MINPEIKRRVPEKFYLYFAPHGTHNGFVTFLKWVLIQSRHKIEDRFLF